MGVFDDMFSMVGNYEERRVDRSEINGAVIDTCTVYDSEKPYETAVKHQQFNNNEWVIVEMYDTVEAARLGHDKWKKTFSSEKPPKKLKDISTASITELCDLGGKEWRENVRQKGKKKKVALMAVMRKLLLILNAMERDKVNWRDRAIVTG